MSEQTFYIGNLDCANCATEVEAGVARLDGVQHVQVDFATGRMTLHGEISPSALRQRVEALGKTLHDESNPINSTHDGPTHFWHYLHSQQETRLALIGAALTLIVLTISHLVTLPPAAANSLYTAAMSLALWPIARSGLQNLVINRSFNINLLMTIAAVGAVVLGEYLEAFTVIFLFSIGESLEGYSSSRARQGLYELLATQPQVADRRIPGSAEQVETVPVDALDVGDIVIVRPGEQIPADGTVRAGEGGVDQAIITGESIPVMKHQGDTVYAGSLNGDGLLHIEVSQPTRNNTLNRLVRLVEQAQAQRAPTQRIIDRFAAIYTPAVVLTAVAVALLPPLLFNAPLMGSVDSPGWLYRALTMLVIACPCALVISTPVTVISSITAASRRGVLIKGGQHLEALGTIRAMAFDKTGTLTQGKPSVTEVHAVDGAKADLLRVAAAVERGSTHPFAAAVIGAAQADGAAIPLAQDVTALPGRGIVGTVAQQRITIGSHSYFDKMFPHPSPLCELIQEKENAGSTGLLLHDGATVRGFIAVQDRPRQESAGVIAALHTLNIDTLMLTGDNETVARAIAAEVGVNQVHAGLLPKDKLALVEDMVVGGGRVAMVGDGINDTPALAAATVGISMGGAASAQAMEIADVVIMGEDLQALPFAVRLARMAQRLIRQNIALTFVVKGAFLSLAVVGGTTMWAAVIADVGTTLLVTLNGMRPLRGTQPTSTDHAL